MNPTEMLTIYAVVLFVVIVVATIYQGGPR